MNLFLYMRLCVLSDEIEQLNARYIAGEIDSDELTAAILASDTVRSA